MQNNPLNKVVFIQKVAAFTKKTDSLKDPFELAYVNDSWNDTIKNYSFHLFETRVREIENINILEKSCARIIKYDVIWFLDVMLSETLLHRVNLLRLACKNDSSLLMMQLVCEKLVEAGGTALLSSQLVAADRIGMTCLMLGCINSSSREVMKLIFDKIVEVGGTTLLKSQVTATNTGRLTCLMLGCNYSPSPEVMTLLIAKIVEAGGPELLKKQLAEKNVGGKNCLMLSCYNASSPEVMRVMFDKLIEVGGTALLKSQIIATDNRGETCLSLACRFSSSVNAIELLAAVLFHFDLFKKHYLKLPDGYKTALAEKDYINDASWVPDLEAVADVKKILKRE